SEVHTMEWLADVAIGVLESCGVEHATVVGHSMGGYVALEILRARPEMVDRLVLMHALPTADSPEKQAERERELKVLADGKKDILAHLAPEGSFAPQNRRRMAEEIEAMAERIILTDDEGAMAQLRGLLARGDQSSVLSEKAVPLCFILGRHDTRVTPERAEAVVADYPAAEVVWLEESGHFGFLEEPEKVAEVLLEK
ncbi:MAG: alpha/beta hydrolase, partial [Tidjanibacter sp.]|nr:alpha/beta hydrolase [Tidjanibacter sp.]